jgi:Ser/Thr protein kinase RdoA (MazF antagonist)
MKAFDAPSLDEQRERLKQLAQAVLARYDLAHPVLTLIADLENTVYCVDTAQGAFALRVCIPDKYDAPTIEAELDWLVALRRDTGLRVPEPATARDGRLLQTVAVEGVSQARHCVLFHWVEGEFRDEPTPTMLEQVGAMTGELHQHAGTYARSRPVHRPHADWQDLHAWAGERSDVDHLYTREERKFFAQAARLALAEIERVGRGMDYGLIHADLHQRNYLFCGPEVGVIDFDDCHFAPMGYDLAVTLWYLAGRPDFETMREALFGGYERVRPLPAGLRERLPVWLLTRYLGLLNWALGLTHPDALPWGQSFLEQGAQGVRYYLDRL